VLQVRRLEAFDVAALRAANALFALAFEDSASYAANPPPDAYLERLLGREQFVALIAEEDGVVVGALVAYELEKFEQARSEFYIYDLAVAEAARRQGVATELIALLASIARERGVSAIYVQADYDDPPAIALYEKLGTRNEVLHFDIAITAPLR
jgi:aminoglycoside 3-N-acetyltransferase I